MVRDEDLIKIANEAYSVSDVMERLGLIPAGGNHVRYKERLKRLGIIQYKKRPRMDISISRLLAEYLTLNGPKIGSSELRRKLIKAGLKQEKCEKCGQGTVWNGEHLNLHLDHVDGNRKNNQIENLRILCPNCHTQTSTYGTLKEGSRRKPSTPIERRIKSGRKCSDCGCPIEMRNKTGLCRKCYLITFPPPRKVSNRPLFDTLLKEVQELGYRGVGRKYGVSDQAVRKWMRKSMPG